VRIHATTTKIFTFIIKLSSYYNSAEQSVFTALNATQPESTIPAKRKPGRQPRENADEVRRIQNRQAQKAFRERREKKIVSLELQLQELQSKYDAEAQSWLLEQNQLRERVFRAEMENEWLKTQLGFKPDQVIPIASKSVITSLPDADWQLPVGVHLNSDTDPSPPPMTPCDDMQPFPLDMNTDFTDPSFDMDSLPKPPAVRYMSLEFTLPAINSQGSVVESPDTVQKRSVPSAPNYETKILRAAKQLAQIRGPEDPLSRYLMDEAFVESLFSSIGSKCSRTDPPGTVYRDPRIAKFPCYFMRRNLQRLPYSLVHLFEVLLKTARVHGPRELHTSWEVSDEFYEKFPGLLDEGCRMRERLRTAIWRMQELMDEARGIQHAVHIN
jgi:hypothetical protein